MKKTYTAPAVVLNGSVVRETMSATSGGLEPDGFNKGAGNIGFNL